MNFPSVTDSYFAFALYSVLLVIIYLAVRVFRSPLLHPQFSAAIIWAGALSVVIGLIAYINEYREAMQSISEVGDISPALVAGAMADAVSYPFLGLFNLGIAFLVRLILNLR